MRHLITYKLFEGGNALELARPIKQSEVAGTLETLEEVIFPALGLSGFGDDVMLIGSAGKKKGPDDESGDIDIGFAVDKFAEANGIDPSQALKYLYDKLNREFPVFEAKWMRGLEVVSFGYPIANDPGKGYVQIDFIPLKDMNWAKFIYHSPDYRKDESKYKSAHRNWLFAAIISQVIEDEEFDVDGNKLAYNGYMLKLSDGLSKIRKSYVGKTKLLKNAKKTEDVPVTKSPAEFVKFLFGDGIKPNDVATFEDAWRKTTDPDFRWADRLDDIKDALIDFLRRVKLPIPAELKDNDGY